MQLAPGDLVDDAVMAAGVQAVKDKYAKRMYPDVDITWTIEESEQPGMANLEVIIDEGPRSRIRKVRFEGNDVFKKRILRKMMKQRGTHLFSWLTGSGVYDADQLERDMQNLRKAYLDAGYLDAQIGPAELRRINNRKIDIVIPVAEGPMYRIGDVSIEGTTLFPLDSVQSVVALKRGEEASFQGIQESRQAVQDYFSRRGYIDTYVKMDLKADPETLVADVYYDVSEGVKAFIRDIKIRGNTRTKDKVIRRELAVYPGSEFNDVRIRLSERRLWNLGYFDYVSSGREITHKEDQYDVFFDVEEKRTGQFMVGAGFSSVDDVVGFAEVSQGNFDLFGWPHLTGGGQKLKLRTQFGTERTDVELSFIEPWFLNRKLSLGVDFFRNDRRFLSDDYNQQNTGGRISLSKPLFRSIRGSIEYALEDVDVYDVADTASDLIKLEEGSSLRSSLTLSFLHDNRRLVPGNPFVAFGGNRSRLSGSLVGGGLGGDQDLYIVQLRSSQYISLFFDHVLNIRVQASVVEEFGDSDRVPIFDRLFLGGARTVRGFDYRDVGPKDEDGEPIGGKTLGYATVEYNIPVLDKFRLAGFYDIGMVWPEAYKVDSTLNSAVGVGLRLDIPGFPLRFDYGWPLEADEFNDKPSGRFSFMIGYIY